MKPQPKVAPDRPLPRRLLQLAVEFDQAAVEYAKYAGTHNALLHDEAQRAARQLRAVREQVIWGEKPQSYGALWLHAAWRIITAIGRANLK